MAIGGLRLIEKHVYLCGARTGGHSGGHWSPIRGLGTTLDA